MTALQGGHSAKLQTTAIRSSWENSDGLRGSEETRVDSLCEWCCIVYRINFATSECLGLTASYAWRPRTLVHNLLIHPAPIWEELIKLTKLHWYSGYKLRELVVLVCKQRGLASDSFYSSPELTAKLLQKFVATWGGRRETTEKREHALNMRLHSGQCCGSLHLLCLGSTKCPSHNRPIQPWFRKDGQVCKWAITLRLMLERTFYGAKVRLTAVKQQSKQLAPSSRANLLDSSQQKYWSPICLCTYPLLVAGDSLSRCSLKKTTTCEGPMSHKI